jgi:hypothetical protein
MWRAATGLQARLGLAVCEEDRPWNALVEVEQHLGLDRESGNAQPGCHPAVLAAAQRLVGVVRDASDHGGRDDRSVRGRILPHVP